MCLACTRLCVLLSALQEKQNSVTPRPEGKGTHILAGETALFLGSISFSSLLYKFAAVPWLPCMRNIFPASWEPYVIICEVVAGSLQGEVQCATCVRGRIVFSPGGSPFPPAGLEIWCPLWTTWENTSPRDCGAAKEE